MDLLKAHLPEIASFIAGALGGSLLTFHYTRQNRVGGRGSIVDQSGAKAGGDVVGGNKTTSTKR